MIPKKVAQAKEKPLSENVFVLQYDTMRYLLGSRLLFADKVADALKKLRRMESKMQKNGSYVRRSCRL